MSRMIQFHPEALPKLSSLWASAPGTCRGAGHPNCPQDNGTLAGGWADSPRHSIFCCCCGAGRQGCGWAPWIMVSPSEAPRTCGCLADEPTPRENWSWRIMKTNSKRGEIPCYCKHSSRHGTGPWVPGVEGPQLVECRVGSMWWLCLCQRRHLGLHSHTAHFPWSCDIKGQSKQASVRNIATVLKWPMESDWKTLISDPGT